MNGVTISYTALSGASAGQYWPHQNTRAVSLRLLGLPAGTNTIDIYKAFEKEGDIVTIDIFPAQGNRGAIASITFSPTPSRPFWKHRRYRCVADNRTYTIRIEVLSVHEFSKMASPVNSRVLYPERIALEVKRLDFGILHSESSMMVMHTVEGFRIQLVLDLYRKQLVVDFPLRGHNQFKVPFAQLTQLLEVITTTTQNALILPLTSPPEFWRKTNDVAVTHDKQSNRWNDKSSWFRITDINRKNSTDDTKPINLRKFNTVIDIGRWTVYRFVLKDLFQNTEQLNLIRRALIDFNIAILPKYNFELIARREPVLPELIDSSHRNTESSSLLEHLGNGTSHMNFAARYQLEVCLSQGYLNEYNLTEEFFVKLLEMDPTVAQALLETVADQRRRIYDPMQVFDLDPRGAERVTVPRYCVLQRSVTITPTTMYYATPAVEMSNRIVRAYREQEERFLRVRFAEDNGKGPLRGGDDETNRDVYRRVKQAMTNGIMLGDRHYEFLAFGNSQFREHGAYFYASQPWNTAADMRKTMGDLSKVNIVAKWGARLGQNFSTTRAINGTKVTILKGPDVERNGFCFTDGVGKISGFLGRMIASELGLPNLAHEIPCLFQFRLGGCKGVLAVDPSLQQREIMIRKSQSKFEAQHNGLEIIRVSTFSTATLNRQLIVVLSALGVRDDVFLSKLRSELADLTLAMTEDDKAIELLKSHVDFNQSTLKLASIILDGFMRTEEPFTMSMLQLWRAWNIKYLKEKARIPVRESAFLLGCVDETRTLKGHKNNYKDDPDLPFEQRVEALPEIFVQIDDPNSKGHYKVITDVCILARNPSLHPGDIRVVRAVNVPALHHLRNVVVLPQRGDRPLANMCSGGDLDGDDYFISWDPDLRPEEWNHAPMDFDPVKPLTVDREVNITDVVDFFVTYMRNDRLPFIAVAHLATADFSEEGVKSEKCIELAQLHSDAVDYPKSGVPVKMDQHLRVQKWPHFMEKRHLPSNRTYHSSGVLGKLYDEVDLVNVQPQYDRPFDHRILSAYILDDSILSEAAEVKKEYDAAMQRIMAQHEIGSEFEVWSGFVLKHNFEKRDYAFAEEIGHIMTALRDRIHKRCAELAGGKEFSKMGPFIAALYTVTANEVAAAVKEHREEPLNDGMDMSEKTKEEQKMPFISMPWLFASELGMIATGFDNKMAVESSKTLLADTNSLRRKPKASQFAPGQDDIEVEGKITHRGEILRLFDKSPALEKTMKETEPVAQEPKLESLDELRKRTVVSHQSTIWTSPEHTGDGTSSNAPETSEAEDIVECVTISDDKTPLDLLQKFGGF